MSNHKHIHQPCILTTVSGKGGVGKSMATVNIADTLKNMGYSVAIIDADLGLSNCATLLNEQVDATVMQWIQGECGLEDLPHDCDGLTLVTGSDRPGNMEQNLELLLDAMDQVLAAMSEQFDFIFIDTPAGSGELSLWALDRANMGMIILVNEPTAISDVYRFCKYVLSIDPTYPFASVVNFAENEESAEGIHNRFNTILQYFMKQQVSYLGFIPASEEVRKSVQKQIPLTRAVPRSEILKELEFISHNIMNGIPEQLAPQGSGSLSHE